MASEWATHDAPTMGQQYKWDLEGLIELFDNLIEFVREGEPLRPGIDYDTTTQSIKPGESYMTDKVPTLYKKPPSYHVWMEGDENIYPTLPEIHGKPIMATETALDYDDMLVRRYNPLYGIMHGPEKLGAETYTWSGGLPNFAGREGDPRVLQEVIMPSNPIYSPDPVTGEMMVREAWNSVPYYYHQPLRQQIKDTNPYEDWNIVMSKWPFGSTLPYHEEAGGYDIHDRGDFDNTGFRW